MFYTTRLKMGVLVFVLALGVCSSLVLFTVLSNSGRSNMKVASKDKELSVEGFQQFALDLSKDWYVPEEKDSTVTIANIASDVMSTQKLEKITCDSVNLREGPDTDTKVMATMEKGDQFYVLSKTTYWVNARLEDGTTGYIMKGLTTLSPEVPAQPVVAEKDTTDKATTDKSTTKVASATKKPTTTEKSTKSTSTKKSTSSKRQTVATTVSRGGGESYSSSSANKLISYAKRFLGVRYVWGASSPSGFDCSGFTSYVFRNNGITLNRVAADQATQGTKVSKGNLQAGDLVFFDTNGGHNNINHVGIYIGGGQFIQASSGRGKVIISDLTSGFYNSAYMTARRVK